MGRIWGGWSETPAISVGCTPTNEQASIRRVGGELNWHEGVIYLYRVPTEPSSPFTRLSGASLSTKAPHFGMSDNGPGYKRLRGRMKPRGLGSYSGSSRASGPATVQTVFDKGFYLLAKHVGGFSAPSTMLSAKIAGFRPVNWQSFD